MVRAHGPGVRLTEWTLLVLSVAAALYGVIVQMVTGQSASILHFATAPAFIIVMLTLVHMWAQRTGVMSSSRYLAMFTAVLGAVIAMSGFVSRETPVYTWGELAIGGALVLVATYEAWISSPSREGRRPLDPRTQV